MKKLDHSTTPPRRPGKRGTVTIARVAAVAVGLTLVATACGSSTGDKAASKDASNAPLQKLRIVINVSNTGLQVPIARDQGFFKDHGIDAEITAPGTPISQYVATLGRQSDIALATPTDLITGFVKGLPLVGINGAAENTAAHPLTKIVVSKDSGIKKISDFKGKTLGTPTLTGGTSYSFKDLLTKNGVDPKDLRWVVATPPQLPDQLKAKRVDAVLAIEPFGTMAVNQGGISLGDSVQLDLADEAKTTGGRLYQTDFVANRDWADQHKDLVLRFAEAMQDACNFMQNPANDQAVRKTMGDFTGLSGEALKLAPIPDCHPSTTPEAIYQDQTSSIKIFIGLLKRVGELDKSVDPEDLLPNWVVDAKN
jgi:NitT/TauT family transport system substrate-binding protein